MRALRSSALVVGSSLAIASGALAQNAVQWRVEDGGNGHWYAVDATQSGWLAARTRAVAAGGDLVSFETMAEFEWLLPQLPLVTHGYLAGGIQDPASAAPAEGWKWLTGSPISSTMMLADDNPCGSSPPGVEDGQQDYLHLNLVDSTRPFGDINDSGSCTLALRSIVEWSADCNNDGIVDYGQIRAGELVDTNGNNIPDCCEQGIVCPFTPVQWRVEDGGNGHWYEWKPQGTFPSWTAARDAAFAVGGYLASIRSESEEQFARSVIGTWTCGLSAESSTAIGGFQPNPSDVTCCWEWVSGEPWTGWEPWSGGAPNNGPSEPESIALMRREFGWNDGNIEYGPYWACRIAAMFEWSADCNSDGIVDYGQIRSGELADANGNYIPDCCESRPPCGPCLADVDGSGAVNGVDLAAILNTWGTSGGKYPGADVNSDGIVNGADLAEVLNSWGPCP